MSDEYDTKRWWFTTGGGVDDGETLAEAAQRELGEETGLADLRLEGPFDHREFDFMNHGEATHQVEYFLRGAHQTDDADLERLDRFGTACCDVVAVVVGDRS